jgi:hypothetical protein
VRRKRWLGVIQDREVLEELRDEPELLAIADTVHGALGRAERERRQRRIVYRSVTISGAFAAALIVALVVQPWGGGRNAFIADALAAVPGRGPVIHTELRAVVPGAEIIAVRTGSAKPVFLTLEFWYLPDQNRLRTLVRSGEETLTSYTSTPQASIAAAGSSYAGILRTAIRFATEYRQALAHHRATEISAAEMIGVHRVRWIELSTQIGRFQVALDQQTLVPRQVRGLSPRGLPGPNVTVTRIETMPTKAAVFNAPSLQLHARSGPTKNPVTRPISAAVAADALGHTPLWLGPEAAGMRAGRIELDTATGGQSQWVEITYHATTNREQTLTLRESATRTDATQGTTVDLSARLRVPAGSMLIEAPSAERHSTWTGHLLHADLFIAIDATTRQALIEAARHLTTLVGSIR